MTSNISGQALPPLAVGKSCRCQILGYLQGIHPTPAELLPANGTLPAAWGAWQSPQMFYPRPQLAKGCNVGVPATAAVSLQSTKDGQHAGG